MVNGMDEWVGGRDGCHQHRYTQANNTMILPFLELLVNGMLYLEIKLSTYGHVSDYFVYTIT